MRDPYRGIELNEQRFVMMAMMSRVGVNMQMNSDI